MAVWKAENCILTLKGEEVLNKLIVGSEKITITRIVTGSSYVPFSQLYKLERIPKEQQTLKIFDITNKTDGSVIKVECSNADLREAYHVYQLGVYATHPSISGEFLYWVGQCDTDTADFLPLPSELPVNLTFGIFLYNLNSKDINILVDYSDYITKDFFDENIQMLKDYIEEKVKKVGYKLTTSDTNNIVLRNANNEELSSTSLYTVSVADMKNMFTVKEGIENGK